MVIVFLPTVVGCKTTLIIYGPKKWGHATGLPYHSQLGLLHAALEDKKATVLSNMLNEEKK